MSQTDTLIDDAEDHPAELGDDEGVYERDSDGELTAVSDTIEWKGQERSVRHLPITTGEAGEFRGWGDDVEMKTLCEVLAEKFTAPDRTVDEWLDTDPRQFMECMDLLVRKATGESPSSEFHKQVREELDSRDGGPGN